MTLTEFLLARIAEDEKGARVWARIAKHALPDEAEFYEGAPTPTRVLAECEAKRRIVELANIHLDSGGGYDEDAYLAAAVLRLLVKPYAQHSDFREKWEAL